jgi:hypothetical protein
MSSMARSTWRPWGWRLSIIVNSSPLRRADPSPRDNVSVVEDAIDPKAVSSEATMMAPDRPAEADPLHQCRVAAETSARSLSTSETVASDTPTAVATVSRVGGGLLVTAPLLFGGPSPVEQGRPVIITSSSPKCFDA